MSDNQVVKKNISGMQVIKTLQMLLEDNYTMSELVENLNKNEKTDVFNNNVISKYINTCRYCGFYIPKIYNKYYLAKIPFGLNFSSRELEILDIIQKFSTKTLSNKSLINFNNLILKFNKFSSKDLIKVDKKTTEICCENFERAIKEKRRIQLMLKTKHVIECIPIEINEYKGKNCFKIIYKNKERNISINRILGLELLGKRFSIEDISEQAVVFKLTGGLAQRYSLRDHEQMLSCNLPEYITVSNSYENKEELLTRLLRYDKNCEILSPSSYRNEMRKTIENMLANYEGE